MALLVAATSKATFPVYPVSCFQYCKPVNVLSLVVPCNISIAIASTINPASLKLLVWS